MSRFQMPKSFLPNLFTFTNLALGVLSLLMTFNKNYLLASIFILCAGLVDRYDGRVARFFNVSSDIGKELDSLADLVSFGVAPSMLTCLVYNLMSLKILGYIIVVIFPIAGAYRLARYNTLKFDNVFSGIPITIAGSVLSLYCLLTYKSANNLPITLLLILGLSYLMVSNIKFKKF
ncbi:CDP-diacylglycerol--serine O-phosphatidyltransferase [Hathewaya histolytica]|uniref:CDP-diacylglycerol--serine O-phosphatidyltransferase n=2 Tax=Hathewaya histolytica TaxID=1498 RepID=A0A4U9R1J4_HATHI|nr:CDP-diacylglycerol--serine O-phosphatidyltransferase [Hathewaya histolytica]